MRDTKIIISYCPLVEVYLLVSILGSFAVLEVLSNNKSALLPSCLTLKIV